MRPWRVVSTTAVLVAIGGCAAAVLSVAHEPSRPADRTVGALPVRATPTVTFPEPSSVSVRPPTRSARPTHTAAPVRPKPHPAPSPASTTPSPTSSAPRPSSSTPTPKPTPQPVRGRSLPISYSAGSATRVITVVAPSTGSTTATLQAWYRAPGGGWLRYGSAVTAHVGSDGLTTQPSESRSATPIGSFTLTEAFGALADPGTPLPYFQTTPADWWISQSGSLYNTHQHCSSGCAFTTGSPNEHLRYETPYYNYAVVIDYNRFPVRQGAGSAFFLHVTDGGPTAGCVAIPQATLVTLMRWLAPGSHPRILIGVS